ncbi:hypothetical protein [Frisingicoccus sp.]|uniref:hypothetical protein n=1 Tax=Frisingicoccus sp. TaxID=1918627 RepID=UPI002EA60032|nr:hypothetical protein [Frisingicoccus sp.]
MAGKVYSFTKVRKQRTRSGVYALIIGIESLALLLFLIGFGIYKGGKMTGFVCFLPYITLIASLVCAIKTRRDLTRMDVSGKYLNIGHRVCLVSVWSHLIIFLVGILKIIL